MPTSDNKYNVPNPGLVNLGLYSKISKTITYRTTGVNARKSIQYNQVKLS